MALGSCRQSATLIMSDRPRRPYKIIIAQQWSESPQWHFHTTYDLCPNPRGHDQCQGSERASVIHETKDPSTLVLFSLHFLLHLFFFNSPFFSSPHLISVSLSLTLSFSGPDRLRHPIPWECKKESKRKSIGKMSEDLGVPSKTECISLCWNDSHS